MSMLTGQADELREYALGWDEGNRVRRDLTAIADRIDTEHERLMQDLIDANNQMEQLCECSIKLPKDADGEPIHVGDVMDGIDKYNSLREVTGKVITVSFEADGLVDVAVQAWNDDDKSWRRAYLDPDASVYRHHHEPTVEDVLEELLREYDRDDSELTNGEIIERFAAKLRLAGDE